MSDESAWSWDPGWARVVGLSVVVAVVLSFLTIRWLEPDCEAGACPPLDRLAEYRPDEPPQVFDADGDLAGTLSGARRIVVDLDSIPAIVREGYVAVEDHRFYEHGGVDLVGGFRAFLRNIRSGGTQEGASTITMQLARNVFGSEVLGWNKWHRKLAEFRLARAMEEQLPKDRILELYLNQIYLGDGVYGVETAARHYFGKPVQEVDTREAAFLIGLAKNPEGYDPQDHPEAAEERIQTVLGILEERGVIDAEAAQAAREGEVEVEGARLIQDWGANAYYLSAVRRELRRIVPEPAQRAGLHVYTGLHQAGQKAAVEALTGQIRAIESGRWGSFRGQAAPDSLPPADTTSPYLQGMVVAMRPESGVVTTLVGGRDYGHSEFDRAFQAKRQPGSAFKPIVYAAALGQGLRLSQTISTDPIRFAQRGGPDWEPADHVTGEQLTVRDALVYSSNTAAVRVGQRVGVDRVAQQAHAMGIESEIPSYPSVFLGAAEVVPADLVAAYATFVNGGHTIEPHLITRIEDPNGNVVYRRDPSPGQRAVDARIAFLVLDMMRDVVTRGTGWRVGRSGLSYPAAGKTGTTNESKDLWFVGMTPRLVAGVWIGFDNPKQVVPGSGGGDLAAPTWATFMQTANQGLGPMSAWTPPPGVVKVRVDLETGYAVPEDCEFTRGEVRTEYFLSGSEPQEWCPYERMVDDDWWVSDTVGWSDRFGRGWRDSVSDSLARDTQDRTIFYGGDEDEEEARRERERRLDSIDAVLERARERRSDTSQPDLDAARRNRDRIRPALPDTTRPRPDTPRSRRIRPDTTRPDTTRPDTTRPDTTRPDTTGPDTTPPATTRPDTTRRTVRPDTTRADTTGRDTTSADTTTTAPATTVRLGGAAPAPVDQSREAAISPDSATSTGAAPTSSPLASPSMPPWASHRSASRAAMQPVPAAVTA